MGLPGSRVIAAALLLLGTLPLVGGCALLGNPQDDVDAFSEWAATQPQVTAVEADTMSGTLGKYGMKAHVSVEGSITNDDLLALCESLRDHAVRELGITNAGISVLVGERWGFGVFTNQEATALVIALRDDPRYIGASIDYQSNAYDPNQFFGSRAVVADPANLVEAYDNLVAIDTSGSGTRSFEVATADAAFSITGETAEERVKDGTTSPAAVFRPAQAIALWQAAMTETTVVGAEMVWVQYDTERVTITVSSPDEIPIVEKLGAAYPDLKVTVLAQK